MKNLLISLSLLASSAAFAASPDGEWPPAAAAEGQRTRAEVRAELDRARADGSISTLGAVGAADSAVRLQGPSTADRAQVRQDALVANRTAHLRERF